MKNTVKSTVKKNVDSSGVTHITYGNKVSAGTIVGGGFISLIIGLFLNVLFGGREWSWITYAIFVALCFGALSFFATSLFKIFSFIKLTPGNTVFVDADGIRTTNNSIPYSDIDLIGTQQNPNSTCFVFVETNGKRVAITGITDKAQATKVQALIVETASKHGHNYS